VGPQAQVRGKAARFCRADQATHWKVGSEEHRSHLTVTRDANRNVVSAPSAALSAAAARAGRSLAFQISTYPHSSGNECAPSFARRPHPWRVGHHQRWIPTVILTLLSRYTWPSPARVAERGESRGGGAGSGGGQSSARAVKVRWRISSRRARAITQRTDPLCTTPTCFSALRLGLRFFLSFFLPHSVQCRRGGKGPQLAVAASVASAATTAVRRATSPTSSVDRFKSFIFYCADKFG
jgi:hypothetical protein